MVLGCGFDGSAIVVAAWGKRFGFLKGGRWSSRCVDEECGFFGKKMLGEDFLRGFRKGLALPNSTSPDSLFSCSFSVSARRAWVDCLCFWVGDSIFADILCRH